MYTFRVLLNKGDPLSENLAHPTFYIEIRLEICISMCNYAAVKTMEVIGCSIPELRSEKHHGRGTQPFEKTQMFLRCYVSPYTIVLCKIEMCSCKKAA